MNPLRLLIIEDDPADATLVVRFLEKSGRTLEWERVQDREALLAALEKPWDAIVSDWSMPGFGAKEALKVLQARKIDLPFLIMSGTIGEDIAVEAMQLGAHDFVLKDRLTRLPVALEREIREARVRAEHARADEALRRSEERFRLAAAATEEVLWDWDLEAGRIWRSEALFRRFGYSDRETPVGWWSSLLHDDDRDRVNRSLEAALAGEESRWTAEYRLRRADGRFAHVLDRATIVRDGPKPRRMIGSMIDLTSRHEAEDALRQSESRFRVLIEQSPALVVVQRKGMIAYVNPTAVERLGYSRLEELIGRPILDLVHPTLRAEAADRLRRQDLGERTEPTDISLLRKDGTPLWVESSGQPMEWDGAPAVVVLASDISQRKEFTSKMMQMDRMIAVGTLAAGVGHEINNPLAYVSANLDFATRELTGLAARAPELGSQLGEVREALEEAREGSERIRDIVADLKTLSRGDDLTVGPVDLHRVLDTAVNMARNQTRHKAQVVKQLDACPPVRGNASKLGQVFLNLIVNAAQAIPEGAATRNEIRVRAYPSPPNVCAEIEDTGSGIPEEQLRRIFDPFFTTKPIGQGTGLGLAICENIVKGLGGRIEVQSTVGKGTRFRVVLSAEQAPREESAPAPASLPAAAKLRVLFVDDEPMLGLAVQRLLGSEHEVVREASSKAALDRLLRGEQFDAILCDLMMPEMTGMDLHARLLDARPDQAARMMFVTGGAFSPATEAFLEKVPNRRLQKPFDLEELRRQVLEIAEGRLTKE